MVGVRPGCPVCGVRECPPSDATGVKLRMMSSVFCLLISKARKVSGDHVARGAGRRE